MIYLKTYKIPFDDENWTLESMGYKKQLIINKLKRV